MPGDGAVHYNHSQFSQAGCNHSQFGQSCCGTWPPRAALARAQRRENKPSRGAQADLTPKLLTVRRLSPRSRTGPTPEQELCPPRSFCSAPGDARPFPKWGSQGGGGEQQAGGGYGEPPDPPAQRDTGDPQPRRAEPRARQRPLGIPSAGMQIGVCSSGMQIRVACCLLEDLQLFEPSTRAVILFRPCNVLAAVGFRRRVLVFVSDSKCICTEIILKMDRCSQNT